MHLLHSREHGNVTRGRLVSFLTLPSLFSDELGINKDRYKSLADEMDSTFAELAGY